MEKSSRMAAVQSPIIPVIGQLIQDNPGTISLGQGVVAYSPPPEAIAAISQFLSQPNNHHYKAVHGIPPLRAMIEQKLAAENGIHMDERCIVVTAGSNMAFMNAILAIASVGDEIILQVPYYFNHEMAITMADCRPVLVQTDPNYQLCPQAIERAITDRTRAVVTISPNNPTGVVYSEAALRSINQLCRERGIYHISDEAYEYFVYNGVRHVSPGAFPDSYSHTISLYSLSKAYGFASWRIGYMVIPKHLFVAVNKIQDTILICPPVVSQYAALGALQAGWNYCQPHIQKIADIRQQVLQSLQTIEHLCTVVPSQGAFYFFLNVHTHLNSLDLVKTLISKHQVAVIPGTTFGMNEGCFLRVAYGALSPETLAVGVERLVKGLKAILSDCL